MGLTAFNTALLVLGLALLIASVALGFARAKRRHRKETKLLFGAVAFGLFGILVIVTTIINILIPDVHCAAC